MINVLDLIYNYLTSSIPLFDVFYVENDLKSANSCFQFIVVVFNLRFTYIQKPSVSRKSLPFIGQQVHENNLLIKKQFINVPHENCDHII